MGFDISSFARQTSLAVSVKIAIANVNMSYMLAYFLLGLSFDQKSCLNKNSCGKV